MQQFDDNSLVFLGDVFMESEIQTDICFKNYICNFETPVVDKGLPAENKVNLKVSDEYLTVSFSKKPYALCLGNNHILDYREEGLLTTLDYFKEKGIATFGAGHISDGFNNVLFKKLHGKDIAILSYVCKTTSPYNTNDYGVSILEKDKIRKKIEDVKSKGVDRVILTFHWGDEEIKRPKPNDVLLARMLVDSGADFVVGHHAHCIQSWELYKGRYIFYGLGNLFFEDLNLDSYYSEEESVFKKKYKKKQKKWNKESLAIAYNPITNTCKAMKLCFDNKELKIAKEINLKGYNFKNIGIDSNFCYRLFRAGSLLGVAFDAYISSPRMISIKDIKTLLKVIRR